MKPIALAILPILVFPAAAESRSKHDILAVAPSPETQQWVAAVSHQIDDTLRYPYVFREPTPSGGVSVVFRCSEGGTPTALQVTRSSGNRMLDGAAISAIQRIKTLHPLPQNFRHDQLFQANIVFATDRKTLAREERALRMASAALQAGVPGGQRPIQMAIAISSD